MSKLTFTISQSPNSANLYLYPTSSTVSHFTKVGDTNNYKCVDEVWYSSDNDTTYVYYDSVSTASEHYVMQDHTTETGTINYVRVIAEAKSQLYAQSPSGKYTLKVYDGTSTASGVNQAPLPTSYSKHNTTFATKPSGGAWTWDAVDNIQIKIACSSPSVTTPAQQTIRPNAGGDNFENTPCTTKYMYTETPDADTNYTYVDEIIQNNFSDTVANHQTTDYKLDLYNCEASTGSGTITNLTIFGYLLFYYGSGYGFHKLAIKTGGTTYYGTETQTAPSENNFSSYSYGWTANPKTSVAWTWSDIDALQIGVAMESTSGSLWEVCTQIYAVVDYLAFVNPQIRTTQIYAVVNYTPATSTVSLSIPENLSVSHNRNINRTNFPDGDYVVSDCGRSGKTLVITGQEPTSASTKMEKLKTMTHYGKYVTVAGLPDSNLNTDYMIVNFSFNQESGEVNRYHWNLELEEV